MSLSVGRLDPYFTSLISDLMLIESRPLTRLRADRDSVDVQRGAFNTFSGLLEDLQSSVGSLITTDPFFDLSLGRSISISMRGCNPTKKPTER